MWWTFVSLCAWVMSLIVATYLGYERGRWVAGFVLGLLFGPLGAIAAGLLCPSILCAAERQRDVERQIALLRRQDQREISRRREARAQLDALVHAVESQMDHEDDGFADRLEELAHDLDGLSHSEPMQNGKLRMWCGWLVDRAHWIRSIPRHRHEEV